MSHDLDIQLLMNHHSGRQDDGGVGLHVRDPSDRRHGQPDPSLRLRDHQTLPGDGERLPGGAVRQQEGERGS